MIPYTYLIGWTSLNLFYYGVRFSKNCNPDDLWRRYFTSSKFVKKIREEYGEPDVIEIRKTFLSKEDAINWEFKVIRRMKAIKDKRFLNCGIQGKFFCTIDSLSDEHKNRIKESWTDERRLAASEHWRSNNPMFDAKTKDIVGSATSKRLKGRSLTEEHRRKISESGKGRKLSESHMELLKNRIGENNPMYGKKMPEEAIKNRIEKSKPKVSGENHWTHGKTHSDEYKKKMSESLKKSWQRRKEEN